MNRQPEKPNEGGILDSPRPWVVLDANVIRSMSAAKLPIDGCSFVVCDHLYAELLDGREAAPSSHVTKLQQLFDHAGVAKRILVANPMPKFLEDEHRSDHRWRSTDLIDIEATTTARRAIEGRQRLIHLAVEFKQWEEMVDYHDSKRQFARALSHNGSLPPADVIRGLSSLPLRSETIDQWIQDPTLVQRLAWTLDTARGYRSRAWVKELSRFPDATAIGKWLRIIAWLGAVGTLSPERTEDSVSNDYEDCVYAFVASYTFNLATQDRRLTRMVNAVFPRVRIWRSIHQ